MLAATVFVSFLFILNCDCARILGIFPNPSISHQLVFRPIILELAKRGHEVFTVTPVPEFTKETAPPNLIEISIQDVGLKMKNEMVSQRHGKKKQSLDELWDILVKTSRIMEYILENNELQEVLQSDKKIDLIMVEFYVRPAIAFSKILNAPVVLMSSFGNLPYQNDAFGIPTHPLIYPLMFQQRIYNLTFIEKLTSLKMHNDFQKLIDLSETIEYKIVKKICGDNHPTFDELYKNVKMMFLNNHPGWVDNPPTGLNIQYIGGIHKPNEDPLPKDIEDYLNSSKNGVIYASFGSNTNTSVLPKMGDILNVLSKMPYNVLFKWDSVFPVGYSNIKFFKWLPQAKLLKHPNIKLFITQGGLQSTDEAINAGVPLIGIPIYSDQYYNSEKYTQHNIGLNIDLNIQTAENFKVAVETVINDLRFKNNVLKLRSIIRDVPVKPLQSTVSWIEYIIKFGGDHLKPLSAQISWMEYYEVELILTLLTCVLLVISVTLFLIKYFIRRMINSVKLKFH